MIRIFGSVFLFLFAVTDVSAQAVEEKYGEDVLRGSDIDSEIRMTPRSMSDLKLSFAPIVGRAAPAVVNVFSKRVVRTSGSRSPFSGDPFFEQFFGRGFSAPQERVQNSLGSGVIVSPDGVIVTNNHVIEKMTEIKVVLHDRREFEAEVLLADPQTDLAVLRISASEPLPFLEFANSDRAEVGDVVLAIGNPFGVGQTVTSGIISALARTQVSISDYQFFIQTDAAINPGNSGGALVDIDGRLVGVNSAIYSRSGGSNGIGFAIPSRMVKQVIASAVDGGELTRPWIGASTSTITPELSRVLNLDRPIGAIIDDVWKGGPADTAGLKPGDVILKIDGAPVYDAETLRYRIGVSDSDKTASVAYKRDGKDRTAKMTLSLPPDEPGRDPHVLEGSHPLSGVTVDNLSPRYNDELGLDPLLTGVAVTDLNPRSYGARKGLRRGYRILSVNGQAVKTAVELEREISKRVTRWEIEIDTGERVVPWTVGR